MELFAKYQLLLGENQQLSISGDLYSGYLTSKDREAMKVVFINLSNTIQSIAQQMEDVSAFIANNTSIRVFNLHNKVIQHLKDVISGLDDEMTKDLYQLDEIPIQGAYDLLKKDNHIIKVLDRFLNECNRVLENQAFEEKSMCQLYVIISKLELHLQERHSIIETVVKMSHNLETIINEVGTQIDKHQLMSFQSNIDIILKNATGMTKPQYELINVFKERQLFIYRRAERAIERDENAIIVFETYVKLLKSIKSYIDENNEILSFGSGYKKLKQEIEGIPRVQEKLDTLYRISGTKQHETDKDQQVSNSSNGSIDKRPINKKLMMIAASTVAFITIMIVYLL